MNERDVVLASLPQASGQVKNRPAIVLRAMPPYGDLLVCGVSTQLRQAVAGFDDVIGPEDPDFRTSGLKGPSILQRLSDHIRRGRQDGESTSGHSQA